jgi:hypothetical protein
MVGSGMMDELLEHIGFTELSSQFEIEVNSPDPDGSVRSVPSSLLLRGLNFADAPTF